MHFFLHATTHSASCMQGCQTVLFNNKHKCFFFHCVPFYRQNVFFFVLYWFIYCSFILYLKLFCDIYIFSILKSTTLHWVCPGVNTCPDVGVTSFVWPYHDVQNPTATKKRTLKTYIRAKKTSSRRCLAFCRVAIGIETVNGTDALNCIA